MKNDICDLFLNKVYEFSAKDKGYAATLKRAAGKRLTDVDANTLMAFYQADISKQLINQEDVADKAFLAACLQCLWKPDEIHVATSLPKIGSHLQDTTRKNFQKRMLSVLDTPWDEDGYLAIKLFRLVKFCKSKNAVVDCKQLLRDLLYWDEDNRIVQKRWIREFLSVEN